MALTCRRWQWCESDAFWRAWRLDCMYTIAHTRCNHIKPNEELLLIYYANVHCILHTQTPHTHICEYVNMQELQRAAPNRIQTILVRSLASASKTPVLSIAQFINAEATTGMTLYLPVIASCNHRQQHGSMWKLVLIKTFLCLHFWSVRWAFVASVIVTMRFSPSDSHI